MSYFFQTQSLLAFKKKSWTSTFFAFLQSARLMEDFLELARVNTDKDLETCGVLGAFLVRMRHFRCIWISQVADPMIHWGGLEIRSHIKWAIFFPAPDHSIWVISVDLRWKRLPNNIPFNVIFRAPSTNNTHPFYSSVQIYCKFVYLSLSLINFILSTWWIQKNRIFYVTTLIIPKQESTSNSVSVLTNFGVSLLVS